MSDEQWFREQCAADFEFYAEHCLKIKHKELASIEPFVLNDAQIIVLSEVKKQLAERGYVRIIVLKGRQQGISTLIEALGFYFVTHSYSFDAYILSHLSKSTKAIFKMVKRFYDQCFEQMKPKLTSDSNDELRFGVLDSGYGVGTAGSKEVGRGENLNFFHGSEVGFWQNAKEIAAGVMNAILSGGQGTHIYLESTANGMGNYFHTQWQLAVKGQSDFVAVFVPWFLQKEYQVRHLPDNWSRTEEEDQLVVNFNLSDNQLAWRRNKIAELSGGGMSGERVFKQEYPCYANEAFQMTGEDGLIMPEDVIKARKNTGIAKTGPIVMGIDPSLGGDRFAISTRQGRVVSDIRYRQGDDVKTFGQRVTFCMEAIRELNPDYIFVDMGYGADLVDRLREMVSHNTQIRPVAFGGSPMNQEQYFNKRAEMYGELAKWINNELEPVSIPDIDDLQADLCATLYTTDSHTRLQMLPKKQIVKRLGFSPDLSDAVALTFAEPVVHYSGGRRTSRPQIVGNV